MSDVCRECGIEFEHEESLRRHVKKHKLSFQEYSLKWNYRGIIPLCHCGCGNEVNWNVMKKSYADFLVGHSSLGKHRTDEEKRRIGEKNSLLMKQYLKNNPEISRLRVEEMQEARTPESERRRIQSTKDTYANMTPAEKQSFSDHAKELWRNGTLAEAHAQSTKTFKERFAAGEYDFTERNQKISKTVSQLYVDGGFEWSKGEYVSTKTGKTLYYRSSWERRYMEFLDSDDSVETWDYEFMFIPYVLNEVERNYVPDFYVKLNDGTQKLVEIKPENLKLTGMNCAKKEAAIALCNDRGWVYEERSFELEANT